jgi:hypothetical protein
MKGHMLMRVEHTNFRIVLLKAYLRKMKYVYFLTLVADNKAQYQLFNSRTKAIG